MIIGSNFHKSKKVEIGNTAYPVIFTHVGVSSKPSNLEEEINIELKKAKDAISIGANIICDVSMNNDIALVQKKLVDNLDVPVGAVSIYETYIKLKNNNTVNDEDFIQIIESECERGLDIITLHATVFKNDRALMKNSKRIISSTSRGGILMLEMLEKFSLENPYFSNFEKILDICKKYNVSISLGPCYRPASVADSYIGDLHLLELKRMRKLCKMALKKDVNIMIEGIGHAIISDIPKIIKKSKKICCNVPYRVMCVSTDIAIGYDHVSSAIASSVAISAGADSVTCVTRSEHLGIPSYEDTIEGIKSTVVAVYSGYIAKTKNIDRDRKMSISRKHNGCIGDINVCLLPYEVKEYVIKNKVVECTMCGKYCPLKKQMEDK